MVGVVNYDKMKKDFMESVYQKMEQELSDNLQYIRSHNMEIQDYLRNSWDKCLRKLSSKYQKLHDSGTTGTLAYGYLSFLWSGVLEQGTWYRMDYYDSRSCISDVECSERFDISLALKRFEQGSNEIRDMFASQTQVKPYLADEVIYHMAECFCIELKPLLLNTLYQVLLEEGDKLYGTSSIKFLAGEFLSNAELVAEWRQGELA